MNELVQEKSLSFNFSKTTEFTLIYVVGILVVGLKVLIFMDLRLDLERHRICA